MRKKAPRIVILLLNWNGAKDTIECLHSLKKLDYSNFVPIVVDNGSHESSVEQIRRAHPHVPILQCGENLGFAAGNNVGIRWALEHRAEWVLLLNNDTTVDPNLLKAYLQAAQERQAKVLGAKILRYHEPTTIDHLGGYWNPALGEFISPECGKPDHPYLNMRKVDYVCGAAMFIHRDVIKRIGMLEPRFFLFWEESDFCTRAKKAGFEIWTAPEAIVWHKVSSSFVGGKPHTHYFWWRSRLLWIDRNCTPEEKAELYHSIIYPQMWKMARHYLIKSLFSSRNKERLRRYKAGCAGIFDYYLGRFGNCPKWLLRKN